MGYTPITLVGETLGHRHCYLNSLVAQAHNDGISISNLEKLPESSPVDRLFKIHVASKLRQVDFIIRTLQDDDIIYVSKALKCMWLLEPEYRDFINPKHLEDVIFPRMITPAISKMKHWLYINLRQTERCLEFYQYYKEININFAIKFLRYCDNDYILVEFPNILTKISPHYLKVFSEKCPRVAKQYFDALVANTELRTIYLNQERAYYNSVKSVLKSDPNIFLDITEKYYNKSRFNKLSPVATEYILRHHKSRFTSKPELYTSWLLHMTSLARQLSVEECEELVVNLARAKYLGSWFSYKNVEPLIKRISPEHRAAFKKRVFVDKNIGHSVDEWPYPIPELLVIEDSGPHVFDDIKVERSIQVKCGRYMMESMKCSLMMPCRLQVKSELDRLFDEYRFHGFDHTFRELRRRLSSTSSPESRRNIFLVMVSKTGGLPENLLVLLKLLARHTNEPDHIRSAIVRSLVNRAFAWRLSTEAWDLFLKFGHDLGLDGSPSKAKCTEGLHAVVLRQLINLKPCEPTLQSTFLIDFSTFSNYSLKPYERHAVTEGLSRILVSAAAESDAKKAANYLENLFNVYKENRVCIDETSTIISAAIVLNNRDSEAAEPLLKRLYYAGIARKPLFTANFRFRCDNASYMNALRHDPSVIKPEGLLKLYLEIREFSWRKHKKCNLDQFLCKLTLYFHESLSIQITDAIKTSVNEKPQVTLARPLATLIAQNFKPYLENLDKSKGDIKFTRFAAAMRVCSNRVRPRLDFDSYALHGLAAKAMSVRALACRKVDTEKYVNKLLTSRRTLTAAILLSQRNGSEVIAFTAATKFRPIIAIKAALSYFHRHGENVNTQVWDIVKPLILNLKPALYKSLRTVFLKVDSMPKSIRADYYVTLIDAMNNEDPENQEWALIRYCEHLENELPNIKKESIENILLNILTRTEQSNMALKDQSETITPKLYPSLFVKYLLLCHSEDDQNCRFEKIGKQYLKRVEELPKRVEKYRFDKYLDTICKCLKYSHVYFDKKYVSCIPVFEKILEWIQEFHPIEKNFKNHAEVQLTMLYFKAVRHSINNMPHIFDNAKTKLNEGVEIVGVTFGRYMAKGLSELMNKYFSSIIEVFNDAVIYYLDTYFVNGPSKSKFIEAIIKGIMEESEGSESRLGVYVLKNKYHLLGKAAKEEIAEIMSKKKETKFFFYAEIAQPDYLNVSKSKIRLM